MKADILEKLKDAIDEEIQRVEKIQNRGGDFPFKLPKENSKSYYLKTLWLVSVKQKAAKLNGFMLTSSEREAFQKVTKEYMEMANVLKLAKI